MHTASLGTEVVLESANPTLAYGGSIPPVGLQSENQI
jgi:hypothetical protein